MAINASRTKMSFDKSAQVLLRDPAAAAITTATTTTPAAGVSLAVLRTAYWHNQEIPQGVFRVGVDVSSFGLVGTTTVVFNLIVSDVVAMSSPTTIGTMTIFNVGYYEFDVDSKTVQALTGATATTKFITVSAVTGGSSINLSFGAWLGKNTDA